MDEFFGERQVRKGEGGCRERQAKLEDNTRLQVSCLQRGKYNWAWIVETAGTAGCHGAKEMAAQDKVMPACVGSGLASAKARR